MTETKITVPEHAKATASLLNNVALGARMGGVDAMHAAIAMLRRAMALNPVDLGLRLNLATILLDLGLDAESEELATFVLKHNERAAIAWQVLGVVNTNRGRLDEAIACCKRAHEIDPAHGQYKFDLAAAYLRAGDFATGLPIYEDRWKILKKTGDVPDAPTWRGEQTGHLAIWPDQGYGDLMMFARFVPWAKERAERIMFMVNPLLFPLFQGYNSIPGVEVACVYSEEIKFDHQICVASLPLVYGLTPDNVPADPGLLTPSPTAGTLAAPGLKIGIAWQGNTDYPGDRMRSIPFREFLPLAADPRNTIFSLQVGHAAGDIAKARAQRVVRDMSAELEGEWSHTAALIKQLDLVVSSCTAVPHLAGALGVPTFIVLPQFADWRWLHGRDDTPWYPKTRLFRQTKVGDWSAPMARVVAAVNGLHQRRDVEALIARSSAVHGPRNWPIDEPDVTDALRRILRPGDCFVDVGANVGVHTLEAARLVGSRGHVVAIEPGSNVLPELRRAVDGQAEVELLGGVVEILDRVAWNEAGTVPFFLNSDNAGGNAVWDPGKFPGNDRSRESPDRAPLPAVTLDDVLGERCLVPRLIKIDTEGAEQRVLEGAVAMLFEQGTPFVIAELHEFGLNELGCSQRSLRELMWRAGYSTYVLSRDGSGPRHVKEADEIRSQYILNLLFAKPDDVAAIWPAKAEAA